MEHRMARDRTHAKFQRPAGFRVLTVTVALALGGCGIAQAPIAHTPNVVATPEQGQVAISVQAAPTVGEVTPVYVSVANGTDTPRSIVPSQVFALNEAGERVAPIPPGEAARQSGNSGELKAALKSAPVSGVAAGRGRRRTWSRGRFGVWGGRIGCDCRQRLRRGLRDAARRRARPVQGRPASQSAD
jgi:hypothetical protein